MGKDGCIQLKPLDGEIEQFKVRGRLENLFNSYLLTDLSFLITAHLAQWVSGKELIDMLFTNPSNLNYPITFISWLISQGYITAESDPHFAEVAARCTRLIDFVAGPVWRIDEGNELDDGKVRLAVGKENGDGKEEAQGKGGEEAATEEKDLVENGEKVNGNGNGNGIIVTEENDMAVD